MKTIQIKRTHTHLIHADVYPFQIDGAQYIGTGSVFTCEGPHGPLCGCAEDDIYAQYYLRSKSGMVTRRVRIELNEDECEALLKETA